MIILIILLASLLVLGSYLLTHSLDYSTSSHTQYECGIESSLSPHSTDSRMGELGKGYIKYYIIAIIFLIFDLEAILIYPLITLPFTLSNDRAFYHWSLLFLFLFIILYSLYIEYRENILIRS